MYAIYLVQSILQCHKLCYGYVNVSVAYWLIFATDVSCRLLKLYRSFVIGDVYYNIGYIYWHGQHRILAQSSVDIRSFLDHEGNV